MTGMPHSISSTGSNQYKWHLLAKQHFHTRVLTSRVSGCLLDSLVHEKCLISGNKTPYILVCVFFFINTNSKMNFYKSFKFFKIITKTFLEELSI